MLCKNCKKEIDNDSKFCEFCGKKIENSKDIIAKMPTIKSSDKDLENLKSKSWYRFLKILYIAGFCTSIYFVSTRIYSELNQSKIIFDNEKTIITCDNGSSFSAKDIDINLNSKSFGLFTIGKVLESPIGGGSLYHRAVVDSAYPLLKFCNPQKINNYEDKESAYKNILNNYKIEFKYKTEWLKFITYSIGSLILIIIAFESLRQLGYYIFLGKFYLHQKILRFFKKQ